MTKEEIKKRFNSLQHSGIRIEAAEFGYSLGLAEGHQKQLDYIEEIHLLNNKLEEKDAAYKELTEQFQLLADKLIKEKQEIKQLLSSIKQ